MRLYVCAGLSEPLLPVHVVSAKVPCAGSSDCDIR